MLSFITLEKVYLALSELGLSVRARSGSEGPMTSRNWETTSAVNEG